MKLPRFTFSHALIVLVFGFTLSVVAGCAKMRKGNHLAQAARFYEAGEYERAEIEYKNVLQAEALNAEAIGQLGIMFFDEGRLRLAVPYLMKARELKPENLEVRRRLGMLFGVFGRNTDVIEEARYILERKPTDDTAPLMLIEASVSDPGQLQAARTKLRQLPNGAADGAPVAVALGLAELRQKNYDAAEAAFKKAVSLDPKLATAHSALASLYRVKKDATNAEKELKTAADLSPLRSGKVLQYGQFLVQSGKTAEARKVLEDLSKKAPDYIPAQLALAEIAASEKRYDDAVAIISKVLAVDTQNPDALVLSGRLSLVKGESDKAVNALEKAQRAYPNSPQVLYYLGLAYSAAGDKQKAIDRLSQSVKISAIPDAMIALAQLNLRKGDNSAVILGLKPLVQQRPDNMQARLLLAEAYRAQGSYEEALTLYRQSEKDFPNNPQAAILSGIALLQQKKPVEARKAFESALERSPGFLAAIEQLVYLDLAEKKVDSAVDRVETALKKQPDGAGLHLLMAKVMVAKRDNARVEAELKRTIELAPNAAEPYLLLAGVYIAASDTPKALSSLQAAAEKSRNDPKPYFLIGLINEQQKNYPAAREAYEKAIAIDPKFVLALNNVAVLYSDQFNELDKAYDTAQKVRELMPNEAHIADTLGWILYKKGQYGRAASLLEESADKLTDQPEVRYHLGVVQYALGQEDVARTSLQLAIEQSPAASWTQDAKNRIAVLSIDPRKATDQTVTELEKLLKDRASDTVVLTKLGVAQESRGDIDSAIATYQTAAKVNPNSAGPMLSLARLYLLKKDSAKALDALKSARKSAPDDSTIGRAVGWLAYLAGDYNWAASLLQDAARKLENDPEVLYQAALATYSVGKVADAEGLMREALGGDEARKPGGFLPGPAPATPVGLQGARPPLAEEVQAREFLDLLALAAQPTAGGRALIDAALKRDPMSAPALMALGALQEANSDATGALTSYRQVLAHYGDFSPAKLRFAIIAASAAEPDAKAFEWAQQARTAFPNDPGAAKALGILTLRKGEDPGRAVSLLRQALSARPTDSEALYFLGLAQIKSKDQAGGRQSLQKAIDNGLRAELVVEARKAIDAK